jgi:hypothetical protein
MRDLNTSVIGIVSASILLTGLVMPYDAFAQTSFKGMGANHNDCSKCPSGSLDKKSDPDRKGHKVIKPPVKKEPPKKEPPKKTPPKKEPPKKVAPKPPAKKK